MAFSKKIVCLANSFKTGGSCIAGREILPDGSFGKWIRPVSARATAEISSRESWCTHGAHPNLLDILDIQFLKSAPHGHQTENYEIDPSKRWIKAGILPWAELAGLAEKPASLWVNSDRTQNGAFNCVSETDAATVNSSLVLLKKSRITVKVGSTTWGGNTKKSYHVHFGYKSVDYIMRLTDPIATNSRRFKEEGDYILEDVYLCISLTEPWAQDNQRCHKLVAAIISNPPVG
jgi:hypothetical protein